MACLGSMYSIQSRDSNTRPIATAARCRARLRWHFSGRRSAGPGNYPGGLPRQGRIAGSCLSTVRHPLPQTRQVSFTGPDFRLGSFRDLGASSRASAARTQASFRLRQRLARKPSWRIRVSRGHESHRALFQALGRPQCIKQDATLFPPRPYFPRRDPISPLDPRGFLTGV